jgi:hypothetical protein
MPPRLSRDHIYMKNYKMMARILNLMDNINESQATKARYLSFMIDADNE